jgi:hypothetical protein
MGPGLLLVWGVGMGMGIILFLSGLIPARAQAPAKTSPPRILTEEEIAREKLYSSIDATIAQKFFDVRRRPTIRVAVFDFTDPEGNVTKGGREIAEKISGRLHGQPQFEVVSREKIDRYLAWNGLSSLGKVDAPSLRRLQHRINTMDPDNGIHCLLIGEVKRSAGRNLHVLSSVVNFQFKIGPSELERNILDFVHLEGEIPLPTEQALQEAGEIILRRESRPWDEGRLVILVNTRGNLIWETEYVKEVRKESPISWEKIPYLYLIGKEEVMAPERIKIGTQGLTLFPLNVKKNSRKDLEYLFLHGKFGTNEVFFDDRLPVHQYRVYTSFLDGKANETYSEMSEFQILSDTTTFLVISFYVPSEKERIRSKQSPRVQFFQVFAKGMEIFPNR